MQYETVERYEASFLLEQGFKLIDTVIRNNKLVTFIFNDSDRKIEGKLINFQNDKKLQGFIQGFEQVNKLIRKEQDHSGTEQRREHG